MEETKVIGQPHMSNRVLIQNNKNSDEELKRRIRLARAMVKLNRIWKDTVVRKHIKIRRIIDFVVCSGNTWTLKKFNIERINNFEIWYRIRLLWIPWTTKRANISRHSSIVGRNSFSHTGSILATLFERVRVRMLAGWSVYEGTKTEKTAITLDWYNTKGYTFDQYVWNVRIWEKWRTVFCKAITTSRTDYDSEGEQSVYN